MDIKTHHLLQSMAIVKHQQSRSDTVMQHREPRKLHLFIWATRLIQRISVRKQTMKQCDCGEWVIQAPKPEQTHA